MKQATLLWRLLRYRVAIMLILFLLLSLSLHQKLTDRPVSVVLACVSLALSYVSATSINDIADAKIDAINHPNSIGRPLITGEAKKSDLIKIFAVVSLASMATAAFINWIALLIITSSILINILYSLPPIRLSYKTLLAPLILGIAYVGVPYCLGLAVSRSRLHPGDLLWLLGLYVMFVGRIILKDFRDRKGDAKFHKPTFLLRFGKNATCSISYLGVAIGGGILVWLTRSESWLALITTLYVISVLTMIRRLQHSAEGQQEQLSIGVGAKMGNGLLITLLCAFALKRSGANTEAQVLISALIVIIFFINYLNFLRNPEVATIAYKG